MNIDDATLVRHLDALLHDFVSENRALFGFWGDLPTESALSEAGWRYFADGYLALRDEGALPQLELVGDLYGRQVARRRRRTRRPRRSAGGQR